MTSLEQHLASSLNHQMRLLLMVRQECREGEAREVAGTKTMKAKIGKEIGQDGRERTSVKEMAARVEMETGIGSATLRVEKREGVGAQRKGEKKQTMTPQLSLSKK